MGYSGASGFNAVGRIVDCERPQAGAGGEERIWVIRIVEDHADGLYLKNPWSQRRVPIHAELLALGFLEYVRLARDWKNGKGQPRIFPLLRRTSIPY